MAIDPAQFEKLGAFYLGRLRDDPSEPVLYDSKDLVTHAVCVGMTGSGKTGLCLALLEEAAIDGVPAIVIDPKGDLGNLLLTFPDLRAEDFRPWIDEDEAARKGRTPEEFAADQAGLWRDGLAGWGQSGDRIRRLRAAAEMVIFTPASTAGRPVNILASLAAPEVSDPESLGDRVQTTAAGLLGLLGIDADPVKSRECILVSAILGDFWSRGEDLDVPGLIAAIQTPPFAKVGVLEIETFFPAKDRFELVMAFNNLLASPGFSAWQQGEPLDVGRMLTGANGGPRIAIFSIAHLDDAGRMFFVSLLLNEVLAWTRAQSGTSSLRAIVYMDEIFGYLPPTANPPSKRPLLTLLKQARAFGVGVVLATQNPVDLDYKALSNCGTWFIGRLQTDRDKQRMLDGLEGAAGGGGFDRATIAAMISELGKRMFLMNNVHDDGPVVFESRWCLSYLRGPLTRDQIRTLSGPRDEPAVAAAKVEAPGRAPTLPPGIEQFFVDRPGTLEPKVLGVAKVTYRDAKREIDRVEDCLLAAPWDAGGAPDWSRATPLLGTFDDLLRAAPDGVAFGAMPASAAVAKNYPVWAKEFTRWLAANMRLKVLQAPEVRLTMNDGESEAEFRSRVLFATREARDAKVEALRKKYLPKFQSLAERLQRARQAVERQQQQANEVRMQSMINVGTTLLGAFLGRKKLSVTTMNRAGAAVRGVGRTLREGSDVARASETVENVEARQAELEGEFEAEQAALVSAEPVIESIDIRPLRGGVTVSRVALVWV